MKRNPLSSWWPLIYRKTRAQPNDHTRAARTQPKQSTGPAHLRPESFIGPTYHRTQPMIISKLIPRNPTRARLLESPPPLARSPRTTAPPLGSCSASIRLYAVPSPETREDPGTAPPDRRRFLEAPSMVGDERPHPPIDSPPRPGTGSSGEAGARDSPARWDDDGGGEGVEGLAVRLAPPLLRASGFVSAKFFFCCVYASLS
jgi:hypothetical protein